MPRYLGSFVPHQGQNFWPRLEPSSSSTTWVEESSHLLLEHNHLILLVRGVIPIHNASSRRPRRRPATSAWQHRAQSARHRRRQLRPRHVEPKRPGGRPFPRRIRTVRQRIQSRWCSGRQPQHGNQVSSKGQSPYRGGATADSPGTRKDPEQEDCR